jgi:hypothetical protein
MIDGENELLEIEMLRKMLPSIAPITTIMLEPENAHTACTPLGRVGGPRIRRLSRDPLHYV